MLAASASARRKQLQPVAPRVANVESHTAAELSRIRPLGHDARSVESLGKLQQSIGRAHRNPWMRLRRRDEALGDADVKLMLTETDPATAARSEKLGLGDLVEPEQPSVERASALLTAQRRSDLHVIETDDAHTWRVLARTPGA